MKVKKKNEEEKQKRNAKGGGEMHIALILLYGIMKIVKHFKE